MGPYPVNPRLVKWTVAMVVLQFGAFFLYLLFTTIGRPLMDNIPEGVGNAIFFTIFACMLVGFAGTALGLLSMYLSTYVIFWSGASRGRRSGPTPSEQSKNAGK